MVQRWPSVGYSQVGISALERNFRLKLQIRGNLHDAAAASFDGQPVTKFDISADFHLVKLNRALIASLSCRLLIDVNFVILFVKIRLAARGPKRVAIFGNFQAVNISAGRCGIRSGICSTRSSSGPLSSDE